MKSSRKLEAKLFTALEKAALKCLCVELEETRGGFNEQGKWRGIDVTQQSDSYLEV